MTKPLVAVTGATGFIGRRLLAALVEAGYPVRALTRRAPSAEDTAYGADVAWVRGALTDTAALRTLVQGAGAVVHCAGAIKALSRDELLAINGAGTKRLAEIAAAETTRPRFIHLSSLAAREPRLSSYAASKRAGEQALRPFTEALRPIILRPSAVYGPGDMETLRIFQMAAKGILLVPWGTGSRTSLVHVDDVAKAVLAALALETDVPQPLEISDGHPGGYTWTEIAAAAGVALQTSPRLVPVPAAALYLAGAAGSLAAQLTRRASVVSWDKVAELLHPDWSTEPLNLPGYKPAWTIEKGFKHAVNWYASRGLLKSNA